MSRRRRLAAAAAAIACASACAPEPRLSVACAVSLREALDAFPSSAPMRVRGGGSTVLAAQLRSGAPGDVFVSASGDEIERLQAAGVLAPDRRCVLAANRLVVVGAGGEAPAEVRDLMRYERVAVADPRTAPLGRYTEQALRALGIELGDRAIPTRHARQAIEYVARGEVDAGIVYRSDAARFADRVTAGVVLPRSAHEPILYVGGVLADSDRTERAAALLERLCATPEHFERYGFERWPAKR